MKQSLPPARFQAPLILIVLALILSASACAKLPRRAAGTVHSHLDSSKLAAGSVLNINTASPQELEKLPGIGKVIAERIIAHREQYGQFRRVEHLMMVRGISDRKFRALSPMIVAD